MLAMIKYKKKARNRIVMVPVIANGIILRFGQWFLIPWTKLTIEMTKHGINTKSIKQMNNMKMKNNNHPTTNIPINAMHLL